MGEGICNDAFGAQARDDTFRERKATLNLSRGHGSVVSKHEHLANGHDVEEAAAGAARSGRLVEFAAGLGGQALASLENSDGWIAGWIGKGGCR